MKILIYIKNELSQKEKDIKETQKNLSHDFNSKYYELVKNIKNNSLIYYKSINPSDEKNETEKNVFILLGLANSGKSTLVNTLFGFKVDALSGYFGNFLIYFYKLNNGKNILLMDTPGLQPQQKRGKESFLLEII